MDDSRRRHEVMQDSASDDRGNVRLLLLLLVLIVGGGAAVVIYAMRYRGDMEGPVEEFLKAMRSKNPNWARNQMGGATTAEWLQALLDRNPQVFASDHWRIDAPGSSGATAYPRIPCVITGTDGREYALTFVLLEFGHGFTIDRIESKDIRFPRPRFGVTLLQIAEKALDGGERELVVEFKVEGAQGRGEGSSFAYDVLVQGEVRDAKGKTVVARREVGHIQETRPDDEATFTGTCRFQAPGTGKLEAYLVADDAVSGKGTVGSGYVWK
jgi:hypothetical protein